MEAAFDEAASAAYLPVEAWGPAAAAPPVSVPLLVGFNSLTLGTHWTTYTATLTNASAKKLKSFQLSARLGSYPGLFSGIG